MALNDVIHVAHITALVASYLPPTDLLNLVVWAMESDLHDAVCELVTHTPNGFLEQEQEPTHPEPPPSLVLRCAAASGCRTALMWLLRAGSLQNYLQLTPPLARVEPLLCTLFPTRLPASVLYEAAKRGDAATVQWLTPMTRYASHEAMAFAAANGYLEIASWIGSSSTKSQNGSELELHSLRGVLLTWSASFMNSTGQQALYCSYFCTTTHGLAPIRVGSVNERKYIGAMDRIASTGDLLLLQAMQNDPHYDWSCTSTAMDNAAANGHLHVVQWLAQHRNEGPTQRALDGAARHGHTEVLEWFQSQKQSLLQLVPTASTLLAALEGGHVDTLQWLHDHSPGLWSLVASRCSLVEAACVSSTRLRVLQWLDDVKDIRLATNAAMSVVLSHGDVQTAQWLADPTGDGANLEHWNWVVAKWMSYEFALWHSHTFAKVAANGHVHLVEWLAHAGPFHKVDQDTLWQCAVSGHLQVVEFVLQRPHHQPLNLVVVPSNWSSFADAPDRNGSQRLGMRCEWNEVACDPPWAKMYVELWLAYRPGDCKRVSWLSKWALYCGYSTVYEQLQAAA